jgi:hypothetical protein
MVYIHIYIGRYAELTQIKSDKKPFLRDDQLFKLTQMILPTLDATNQSVVTSEENVEDETKDDDHEEGESDKQVYSIQVDDENDALNVDPKQSFLHFLMEKPRISWFIEKISRENMPIFHLRKEAHIHIIDENEGKST